MPNKHHVHTRSKAPSSEEKFSLLLFGVIVILNALDAYSIGRVPLQWIAQLLTLIALGTLLVRYKGWSLPYHRPFIAFFILIVALTSHYVLQGEFRALMPEFATTKYEEYIGLRVLSFLAFFAAYAVTYCLCEHGLHRRIARIITVTGVAVAIVSLYIYFAQLYGLPEPPRTRVGTSSTGLQLTTFTYAYHRAMGTFREPNLLAAWILLPLLLVGRVHKGAFNIYSALMGTVLLLTGSLGGILALVGGLAASLIISPPAKLNVGRFIGVASATAAALLGFSLFAQSYSGADVSLFGTLWPRIDTILNGGMSASNRGYVYDYFRDIPTPWIGTGLGHPTLVFTMAMGSARLAPLLSFYFTVILSGGILLFPLIAVFLIQPLWAAFQLPSGGKTSNVYQMVALYCAWLILFAVAGDELTVTFGLAYALVVYEIKQSRKMARDQLRLKHTIHTASNDQTGQPKPSLC